MRRLFLDDEELMLHDVKVNGKREREIGSEFFQV